MKIDLRSSEVGQPRREAGIDWLTAVFHINLDGALRNSSMVPLLMERIRHVAPNFAAIAFAAGELPQATTGRRPYALSIAPAQSVLILWHPARSDVVCEMGGRACADARARGLEFAILGEFQPYLSRLDLAVDIYGNVKPSEFISAGYSKRVKSIGHMSSPEGETYYVGSRSSEAFARVYRYSPPHIRSDRLRVETVFRRSLARQVAAGMVGEGGLNRGVATASARFGWVHQCWVPDSAEPIELHRLVSTPSVDGKLRWIQKQVVPTLRSLAREGIIDERSLLEMVFGA